MRALQQLVGKCFLGFCSEILLDIWWEFADLWAHSKKAQKFQEVFQSIFCKRIIVTQEREKIAFVQTSFYRD